jgi:hypothetical protein
MCVGGLDTRIAQEICASCGTARGGESGAFEDFGAYGNRLSHSP